MLQKGLLYTTPGTCQAGLLPRTSYVITGKVASAKPWVTLCSFASPIRNLTPKMKKGFRLLYQSGCDCQVSGSCWETVTWWLTKWSVDCLSDLLTDWLTCRQSEWAADWLCDQLTGQVQCRMTEWPVGLQSDVLIAQVLIWWLADWPIDCLTGRVTYWLDWLIGGPIKWLDDLLTGWVTCCLVEWYVDWLSDELTHHRGERMADHLVR